uniref:Uncharacterized protein n=1 Tax=viral metagenome TaxID=1070528 RepID=A0A6M3JFD9_9ZZZZ
MDAIRNLLKKIDLKIILIVCLLIGVVTLGWASYWRPKAPDTQKLLADMQAKLQKQFQADIKDRDAKIRDLTSRVTVSNGVISSLRKKMAEVKNEPIKEPPKTNRELRDRFIALGFPPK